MLVPVQYRNMDLTEFLAKVLYAYPSVEAGIDRIVDGMSDEYKAFHILSLRVQVTTIWFRQRGYTWQVNRASNIRNTAGYERYVKTLWHHDPKQPDEHNIAYRTFSDKWYPWVTLRLRN